MSARRVCSGTRPSRYHSLRLISAPPRHPPRKLVGDALGDERGVELRLLDLLDVEVDLRVAGDLEQAGPKSVGLGAAAPDHDAGPGRIHVDPQAVARPLDLDTAHGGVRQLAAQ